jgi:hypothetical protein
MRHRSSSAVAAVTLAAVMSIGLAACASSGHPAAAPPSRSTTAPPRSSTSTTRPAPSTTHPVNPVVADGYTQLALRAAMEAAHSLYLHGYDYTAVSPASLGPLVPSLHFGAITDAGKQVVGVLAEDRNDVLLAAQSASGRWYCIIENATDGLSYGEGSKLADVDSNGECQRDAWPPPGEDQSAF